MTRTHFAFLIAMVSSLPATAWAAEGPSKTDCFDAHERGQSARKAGKIRDARTSYEVCAHKACPKLVRDDCAGRLEDTKDAVPSISVAVQDADGKGVTGARITIDGAPASPGQDGRILMDTGKHTLRAETSDGRSVEESIELAEGQKLDWVGKLPSPEPTAPAEPPPAPVVESGTKTSPLVYVLGGVAVVGIGGFAIFGLSGKSKEGDLDKCKPDCASSDVDSMRSSYLLADISLGVALVAGGAATYLYLSGNKSSKEGATYVGASPRASGGQLTFGGHF